MFPVCDRSSGKESWYIPGISVTFDSFDEALTWLIDFLEWLQKYPKIIDFLKWLQKYPKIDELVQELKVFFQSPLSQGILEKYLNYKGESLKYKKSHNEEDEREDMEDMQR